MRKFSGQYVLKSILLITILILVWLPLIQSNLNLLKENPLGGAIVTVQKPTFSIDSIFNSSYQKNVEDYYKSNFGFRNTMIRLNNQKMYSLFNFAKANGVIIGKENYLYEENYILSYIGQNFVGDSIVNQNMERFLKVKEQLNFLGKDIIYIIAPGKASFFPEYIPDKYLQKKKHNTNYQAYINLFEKNNINYIDFRKWFIENKEKSKYPLYPKCGIHWSAYSEIFVTDSIIKYIADLRRINLPNLVVDSIIVKEENSYEDNDIGEGMNLLFNIETYKMAYPIVHFEHNDSNINKVKTLVVGDSYYWGLTRRGLPQNIFEKNDFWYYNDKVYSDGNDRILIVDEVNLSKTIDSVDVIILLFSEMNLVNFDYGFTQSLFNEFFKTNPQEQRVKYFVDQIYNSQEWLSQIKKQAEELKRPLKQLINENAEWMVENEKRKD